MKNCGVSHRNRCWKMLWVYQNNVFLNYSDFSYNEGWSDFLLLELRMKKLIVGRFSDEKCLRRLWPRKKIVGGGLLNEYLRKFWMRLAFRLTRDSRGTLFLNFLVYEGSFELLGLTRAFRWYKSTRGSWSKGILRKNPSKNSSTPAHPQNLYNITSSSPQKGADIQVFEILIFRIHFFVRCCFFI